MAVKTKDAISDILNKTEGKLHRVTLTRVGYMIGATTALKRNLDKLPETKAILEQHFESTEDFQVRRIQAAAQKIIDEGNKVYRWKLILKGGLSSSVSMNLSPLVDKEINRQIGRSGRFHINSQDDNH